MFSDPEKNVAQLALSERAVVADFGAGTGAYSFAAARKVGDFGKVYAIEVQKDLATRLKNEARNQGLSNIEVIWGDIEENNGTKLADGVADVAIVANILFQVEDEEGLVKEVKRIVRSGGKVLVVDWKDSFGGTGPVPEAIVRADVASRLFEVEGFNITRFY